MGNSSNYPYLADEVFAASRGHYVELAHKFFGGMLEHGLTRLGRHVPDPWKGGNAKDGMRLDAAFNTTGKLFFNSNIWGHSSPMINFMQLALYTGVAPSAGKYLEMVGEALHLQRHDGKNGSKPLTERELAALRAQQEKLKADFERQQLEQLLKESAQAKARNQELWSRTEPLFIKGVPNPAAKEVFEYFKNRGLDGVRTRPDAFNDLRFCKGLRYREGETEMGSYDCLISRVRTPQGDTASLHRTYLFHGRKAPVGQPKKLTPADRSLPSPCRYIQIGGAVTDGVIGLAEGIETAVSCFLATGIPTYSAVCAQNLKVFEAPANVHTVLIFADKDASGTGQEAAYALQTKLKTDGILSSVILPKPEIPQGSKGIDWNDEFIREGVKAFPSRDAINGWVIQRLRALVRAGYASFSQGS